MGKKHLLLIALLGFLGVSAQAETLQIPINQQGLELEFRLPSFGESQSSVLSRFGEPEQRRAPVGQPPITRWDYADFSVYFEYQTVINSVKKHYPQVTEP